MRLRIVALLLLCVGAPALAQQRPAAQPPKTQTPEPPPPEIPLVYEPQLLRLSETLGVIAYTSQLCGESGVDAWRQRAEQLIEAEGGTPARRERLAGAYNRGFLGHQAMHRGCSDRTRLVIERKLKEARDIAQDLSNRFGG